VGRLQRIVGGVLAGSGLAVAVALAADGDPAIPAARQQVFGLALAVAAFQRDAGRLPTSAEGLGALLARPPDVAGEGWLGPYLDAPTVPRDPWGHDYVYRLRPGDVERPFTIYSLGPDGVSVAAGSDPDDIALWPAAPAPQAGQGGASRLNGLLPRLMRGPLGLVLVLLVVVGWLRFAIGRMARSEQPHPGGYVPRHRRRYRPPPTATDGPGPGAA